MTSGIPPASRDSSARLGEELAAIVQASPVPIVAVDLDGNVQLWSAAAERLFGWSAAEVAGRAPPIVPDDKRAEFEHVLEHIRGGRTWIDLRTTRTARDGRRIPVSISIAVRKDADGRVSGSVATLVDLSEQAALRAALDESEQRFAAAFDASPTAKLLIRRADRRIVEVNRAYLQMFGVGRVAVDGRATDELQLFATSADRDRFWRAVDGQPRVSELDFGFRTAGGLTGEAVATVESIRFGGGELLLVVVQDVTERRRAERALHESDARFRQLAAAIEEVFWLTDASKHQMIYVSPGYEQIWGRSCSSLYDNPTDWIDAIHPSDRERVVAAALKKQSEGTYDEEYRIVRPDGEVRWVRDRAFPVRDASGEVFRVAGTAQDVTQRRELEAQLRQTQKMESIGLLAGGIAHDFNNWLTVISGNCNFLRELLPAEGEATEILGQIQHAGERAAALTRQLLAFSRREVVETRVVDLFALLVDTEKMLRRLLARTSS